MAKVRVQDATRELSAHASKVLDDVARLRKQSQEVLGSLRKISDGFVREERERQERAAREELQKQYEAAAQFMTAYSSQQAPEVPKEGAPQPEPHPQPSPEAPEKAAPEAPKAEAPKVEAPAEAPKAEAPKAEAPKAEIPVAEAPKAEAPKVEAPKAPERPKFVPGIRVVQTKAEVEASEEARRRQLQQQRQQRQANPQQGAYGRPAGQSGPYGRPANPQGPYGRPANPQGPYGRPANPQGPYGRPAQSAQPGAAPRPAGGGFNRPARPAPGRKPTLDLAPAAEKERVSNYDPNKKNYVRQHDPERVAKNRKQLSRESFNGLDDDVVRGGRRARVKKPSVQQMMAPIKIDKAYMTAETITVKDLTERIGKPAGEILKKLLLLGIMANINSELDYDTASLVCSDFGVELELNIAKTAEEALIDTDFEDAEEDLVSRPPVVTIMGHVDHGKTSLLDYIRHSHVTAGEAGGITQHIGAYTVSIDGRQITFLDTPGHEAFTAMRARGTQATDIAVLVVAADDGVMPQTVESINHARAAGVPIIVAINKMDKEGANPDRVKQDLTAYNLVPEEWGGDTIMAPVSALTGEGVDDLLEMILLQADVMQLRANPNRMARGVIIEAKLDKNRGPLATVLLKNGTLHVGDNIVAGMASGRVRAMLNDRGERVKEAGPSMPVEIAGFTEVPEAGDDMMAVADDRLSRQVAQERREKMRAARTATTKVSLDNLFDNINEGKLKNLNLIVKADVQGSVEAVKQALEKLSNDEVKVHILHSAVGAITKDDVNLASAFGAIIIGFNIRPDASAREAAAREEVDIRLYRIIYQAIEDIEAAMKGMLAPQYREEIIGHAEVRSVFKVSGVGMVAGCYVKDGKLQRNASVRLVRDNIVVFDGKLSSLRRFKDDVKEVAAGYECGVGLENYNDIKENDEIECFIQQEIER